MHSTAWSFFEMEHWLVQHRIAEVELFINRGC